MKVFITGTEHLSVLNDEIILRLDNIIRLNADILIGNYKGVDQLVLRYLSNQKYSNVTVVETGSRLSFGYQIINVGRYPQQDIWMSQEADYMLAIHDGKSRGVAANLRRMPSEKIRLVLV
ncbi:MAG: hypothetical protein RLZZ338_1422 [Cyanobacteriota bacterium]|jgi:hypothetical protein